MSETLDIIIHDAESSHRAAVAAHQLCKRLAAAGKKAHLVAKEAEDDRSVQQNRFYWGVVLTQIAEQARVNGQRYAGEAWHELFKRQFLGYRFKKVMVAGRRRKTVSRVLRSTTDLTVRQMSKYLEQVIAFAVTDLNVRFTETRWEDHQ